MLIPPGRVALAAFLALSVPASAKTVTINFNRLTGYGSFERFHEHHFTVVARRGSTWLIGYGHPAPGIYFETPPDTQISNTIHVRHGGGTFSFTSVEVYSSTTPIPYRFKGTLKGAPVFTVEGTVPNTYGAFAKVTNPDAGDVIDTLDITLTNPAGLENPMALDNIKLVPLAR